MNGCVRLLCERQIMDLTHKRREDGAAHKKSEGEVADDAIVASSARSGAEEEVAGHYAASARIAFESFEDTRAQGPGGDGLRQARGKVRFDESKHKRRNP